MVLLGSIHRWELVKVIEKQVGRDRRLQIAALWHKEAEMRRRDEEAKKRVRRPSRFEVRTFLRKVFRPPCIKMLNKIINFPGDSSTRHAASTWHRHDERIFVNHQ